MFKTALRNVLAHKGRLLMTALAVLLGTAFVAGTLVFTDTAAGALKNSAKKDLSGIAVQITDHGQGGGVRGNAGSGSTALGAAQLAKLSRLPGVAGWKASVDGFAGVADKQGKLIGDGWSTTGANYPTGAAGSDDSLTLLAGAAPTAAGQIALDKATADKGGYHVGDTVRIAVNGPVLTPRLTGIVATRDGSVNSGGSLVLFDTATAQRLYAAPGFYQQIDLRAAPGTSQRQLLDEVDAVLPHGKGVEARTGQQLIDDQSKEIADATGSLNTALLAFAGIALFVGIFIIANTFTMLVAQRTRELALMRAIGASRRQVTRSVQLEALFIGLFAGVAGLVVGIGIAVGMRAALTGAGANLPSGPLVISPTTVAAALGVGVLVTLLAAWLPARRAAKIPPVAALASVDAPATQRGLLVRNLIGAALSALGVVLVAVGAAAGDSSGYAPLGAGAALTMIGLFVLTPLLSRPVIALSGPLLGRLFGVSGKLARQNAVRNPRRTAATASALTIGIGLITALTVVGFSMQTTIKSVTTSQLRGDYQVSMANRSSLDGSVARAVAKAPGVTAVSPIQRDYFRVAGTGAQISGVDPATVEQTVKVGAQPGAVAKLAEPDTVMVEESAAKAAHVAVGDRVASAIGTLTVVGTYPSNIYLEDATVSNATLAAHHRAADVKAVLVKTADGASDREQQAIVDALGQNPLIQVHDKQRLQDDFSSVITLAMNILYGLLSMAVVIAVLGVVNTLAMSVFERKREIGMLRAVGLDRVAVKRMVRLEAVVISLFGGVLGLAVGAFLAWAVGRTIHGSLAAYGTSLPWDRLGLFLLASGLVGLVAALWPARSAARLGMLQAIKSE
ncbi:ABC transporter permease [Streptacidiphilus monticola]|uniref:ABC transporter permease n=1 Tax=Streptacidiphilus monticola TaxID=2161674 RepID=A0ABW1FWS1_9ACTN